jgi:hypothetical protein
MKKIFLIIFVGSILFGACKKTYTCKCTNSLGTYDAGEVEAKTKSGANKKCKTLSGDATTCSVK